MSAEKEPFRDYIARLKREKAASQQAFMSAFRTSPAVLVEDDRGRQELWIWSPDPSEPGNQRITFFLPEGPRGHASRLTLQTLVEDESNGRYEVRPVDEDFVLEWMSTPEFEEGSRRIAFIQADNDLRYLASQIDHETYQRATQIARDARDLAETDMVAATRLLERAIAELKSQG